MTASGASTAAGLGERTAYFLRLGTLGFGGLIALMASMRLARGGAALRLA